MVVTVENVELLVEKVDRHLASEKHSQPSELRHGCVPKLAGLENAKFGTESSSASKDVAVQA